MVPTIPYSENRNPGSAPVMFIPANSRPMHPISTLDMNTHGIPVIPSPYVTPGTILPPPSLSSVKKQNQETSSSSSSSSINAGRS